MEMTLRVFKRVSTSTGDLPLAISKSLGVVGGDGQVLFLLVVKFSSPFIQSLVGLFDPTCHGSLEGVQECRLDVVDDFGVEFGQVEKVRKKSEEVERVLLVLLRVFRDESR